MADLPSVMEKINDLEVTGDAPTTEALWAKVGSTCNWIIDNIGTLQGEVDALNAESFGKLLLLSNSASVSVNSTTTLLSFTSTYTADDYLEFEIGQLGANFAAQSSFPFVLAGSGGSTNLEIRVEKNGTAVHTRTVTGGAPLNTTIGPLAIVFKPGAGTHTYRVQMEVGNGTGATYGGARCYLKFRKVRC